MGPGLAIFGLGAALLGSVTADAAAGARLELMGGAAPLQPGEPTKASIATALTPLAALRLSEPSWDLVCRYWPRLYLREPNPSADGRLLLLHQASIGNRVDLSPTVTWQSSLQGTAGSYDYTVYALSATPDAALRSGPKGQPGVVQPGGLQPPTMGGAGQPTLPPQQAGVPPANLPLSVLSIYDVSFDTSFALRTSARTSLDLGGVLGDSGSLNSGSSLYPHHQRAVFEPSFAYALSPVDDVKVPAAVEYHAIETTHLFAGSAQVDLTHRFSVLTKMRAGIGGVFFERVDPAAGAQVRPSGLLGITQAFAHLRELRIDGALDVIYQPLLYVQIAQYRPTLTLQAGVDAVLSPRWKAGARVSMSTTATAHPYVPGEIETFFIADAPVVYQATPSLAFELGARTLWNAQHFSESLAPENVQVWAYGAVTVLFATTEDPGQVTR